MLNARRVVFHLDIRDSVGSAAIADEQAVALGVVPASFRFRMHGYQSAVRILRPACRDPFRNNARPRVAAQMEHFCAGVRLLMVVGNRNGIKFSPRFVPAQYARRILPRHRGSGFDLCPHDFGSVASAVGPLGDKIVDAALPVLVARKPVLHGGVLDFGVFKGNQFDDGRMQLGGIALRGSASFKIADVRSLVGNNESALELPRILGVDAEVCRKLHRAAHAGRHVDKRSI